MATFALLTDDLEFDITALSYDWQTEVKVTAAEQRELNLWDEAAPMFSYADDAEKVADLISTKLKAAGYQVEDIDDLARKITKLAEPGPALERRSQITFQAAKIDKSLDPKAVNHYMESLPECSALDAIHAVAFFFSIPEVQAKQLVADATDFVWHEDL